MNYETVCERVRDGSLNVDLSSSNINSVFQNNVSRRVIEKKAYQKLKHYKIASIVILVLGLLITVDVALAGGHYWIGLLIALLYVPMRSAITSTAKGYILYTALQQKDYFEYLKALDMLIFKEKT